MFALLAAGVMQRLAAGRLRGTELTREAVFSLWSSYACFVAALAALLTGALTL